MKKLIAPVLVLVCILSLSACSFKNDVPTFDDIQDYTEEDFEIYLNRVKKGCHYQGMGRAKQNISGYRYMGFE